MSLTLENLSREVDGVDYIRDANLTFEAGSFNVLLGRTLAGKTSLMRLMAGLDKPDSGPLIYNGEDVTGQSVQSRNISMIYQQFINYPSMSVYDNIASPLRLMGKSRKEIDDAVRKTADLMQLTPMLGRKPLELSGGQQQRCALARALVKDAGLVLLDEPLANLDYKLREELRDQLPELFAGRGAVVVYATSEPEEALLLGGKTALMDDGSVAQFGTTADIYRHPETLLAAEIFSDPPINVAQIEKRGGTAKMGFNISWNLSGHAADLKDGEYKIAVRANHVLPFKTDEASVPITGHVMVTELSGSESSAHFKAEMANWVSLARGVHPYQVGEDHQFFMDPSKCFVFAPDGTLVG